MTEEIDLAFIARQLDVIKRHLGKVLTEQAAARDELASIRAELAPIQARIDGLPILLRKELETSIAILERRLVDKT
jgi:uncharacterized membrane protein